MCIIVIQKQNNQKQSNPQCTDEGPGNVIKDIY